MAVSVVQQLVVTVGYGAGNVLLGALGANAGARASSQGLWVVASVGLTWLAGMSLPGNQAFQAALFVVAGMPLTGIVPAVTEPHSAAVTPCVALYLVCVGTGLHLANRAASGLGGYCVVYVGGLGSFVIAFAVRTCQDAFRRAGQVGLMQVLCFVYMVLLPTEEEAAMAPDSWGVCMLRLFDSFAAQGLILTITSHGPLSSVTEGEQMGGIYCVALLTAYVLRAGLMLPRSRFCWATFCFAIAQTVLSTLRKWTTARGCVLAFACGVAATVHVPCEGVLSAARRVAVVGFCLAFGDMVNAWLRASMQWQEQLLVYGIAFAVVQHALDGLRAHPLEEACAYTERAAHAIDGSHHHDEHFPGVARLHERLLVVSGDTEGASQQA